MRKNLLYIVILIQILIVGSLIKGIFATMGSDRRIAELQNKKASLEKEGANLDQKIQESKSDYYLEKVAREQLHMVKEGETVVLLPSEAAQVTEATPSGDATIVPNWKKWIAILFVHE